MSTLTVRFEKGRLEERKECVIVNSTNQTLDLQINASSKSLAEAAGPQLQKECNKLKSLSKGQVKVSDGFKLQCKKVLHCWIGSLYEGKHSEKDLENAIMECLRFADKELKCKSIAFPALGTGVLKYPADIVARYFIRCMKKYTTENLTDIVVVIFPNDDSIYQKFSSVFEQHRQLNWSQSKHFMYGVDKDDHGKVVTLTLDSPEYMHVESNFTKTIPSSDVTIFEITRIQNLKQWKMYKEHLRHVSAKYNVTEKELERTLWHSTTEEECSKMADSFINRSNASESEYGMGAYFARDASYLDSKLNNSDEKIILQVKVVVGKFVLGNSNYRVPPRSPTNDVRYDSVVNNEQDPSIFVVFEDAASYPEYIIKYKKETNSAKDTGQALPIQSPQPSTPMCNSTESSNNSSCTIL